MGPNRSTTGFIKQWTTTTTGPTSRTIDYSTTHYLFCIYFNYGTTTTTCAQCHPPVGHLGHVRPTITTG